jgi:hypothetical protein
MKDYFPKTRISSYWYLSQGSLKHRSRSHKALLSSYELKFSDRLVFCLVVEWFEVDESIFYCFGSGEKGG